LIKEAAEMDETDYLLSTEANRQHLQEAIESLKNPDSYIYVDGEHLTYAMSINAYSRQKLEHLQLDHKEK
jgi:hypothetical protein